MPILQGIPLTLRVEDVLAAQGGRPVCPELMADTEAAIALGQTLWEPRAVYEWIDVREVEGEKAHLWHSGQPGTEAVLRLGPKASLLQAAQRALVGVGTIGPALERKVHELQAAGDGLKSYLLDSVGVVALGAVGAALRRVAEDAAAAQGWGVSPALSPGSLIGWPLRDQRELCSLLPLDAIAVHLNEYCVLEPHKSFSLLIGLGPDYASAKVGSVCGYCSLRSTCWRRREDVA